MFRFHSRQAAVALTLLLPSVLAVGCGEKLTVDPETHAREIREWQRSRLERLTSETGWLTLVGLGWLHEGANTCGSGSGNQVSLPAGRAPESLGTFWRQGDQVRFEAKPGVEVFSADSAVTSLILKDDHHEEGPTILKHGSLSFYVIRRGDQLGVRVKDSQSRTRLEFGGLEYFPIDPKWCVEATFNRFDEPRVVVIPAMSGPAQTFSFPGVLAFSIDGKDLTLLAAAEEGSDENLFIMFSDETSGFETYGAGRQLYTPLPDGNGRVLLDFNKAYNWPCVFTEFATCPLPPKENILPLRVEAGEKVSGHHE